MGASWRSLVRWFESLPSEDVGPATRLTLLVSLLAVAMAVVHLLQIYEFFLPSGQFRNLHVGFAILIVLLAGLQRLPPEARWQRAVMVGFALLSLVPSLYIHFEYNTLVNARPFGGNTTDIWIGILFVIVALFAAAREWGWIVPALAALSLVYGYYGYLFPDGLFFHAGMPFHRLVGITSIPPFRGLLGNLTVVSAGTVFLFMVFAGVLKSTGGLELIIRVAHAAGGRSRAGPAQVAVISSGLMGMISGSTVANVASTGAFTIPTMKRFGFRPEFAGAVEAVASTGGQIMPPIMGLAAFLIVGVTGIPYVEVMLAAVFPALIYYVYLMMGVHLRAAKFELDARTSGLAEAVADDEGGLLDALRRWGHVLIGIAVLIYFLVNEMPPGTAALYAIATLIAVEAVKQLLVHRGNPLAALGDWLRIVFRGLDEGARSGAQVAIIIAVINILVEVLVVTGFAQKLSHMMLDIAGQNLVLLLVLSAATCLAFGLGLPTSAAYILVALLGAPALVELGVPLLAAHMYVFLLANISSITPPVAVASMVAANIAKGSFFPTAFLAVRLGLPGFLLPFLFVVHPEILGLGAPFPVQLGVSLLALVAVVALNVAMEGYLFRRLGPVDRLLLLPAAFGLLEPHWMTTVVAMLLLAGVVGKEWLLTRRETAVGARLAVRGDRS